MENERPAIRIGTAERTAAMRALDEHLDAGRLDVEEYGERSARASVAVTAPELAALFHDLPAPHPPLPGIRSAEVRSPLPAYTPAPLVQRPSTLQVWAPRLLALAPLLALVLFLTTHTFFVFLLIPLMGALLSSRHNGYGGHGRYHGPRR